MNLLFLGFYLGAITMIVINNINWYINKRKKAYLYFSLLQIFMMFLILQNSNIFVLGKIYMLLNACIVITLAFLFVKEFLDLKTYYKKIDTLVNFMIIAIILFTLYALLTKNYLLFRQPFSLIFFPFIPISYFIYKKGLKEAKYFVFAWSAFVLSIMVTDVFRILEIDTFNKFQITALGNFMLALILSFALSQKTKNLIIKQKEQEQMLIQQSKLASLGEMLTNISHQWRQPLNRIASYIMNMQIHLMDNSKEENFLLKKLDESQIQLEYMSQTIYDFTNFYTSDKSKQKFNIKDVITNVSNIINTTLKSSNINLIINIKEDYELNSYPKELAQVLLNILQNAKEALVLNKIQNPTINVILDKNILSIEDNAKGIKEEIINKIYEPYFTNKNKGTGIGLYMSKMILNNNLNAEISVKNVNHGAMFIIKFKK